MSNPEHAEMFEWDDDDHDAGNVAHLAKHNVTPTEVEQIFSNGGVFLPNVSAGSGDWKMIGPTDGGRLVTIVLVYYEDRRTLRAFTGWDCTRDERKHWNG